MFLKASYARLHERKNVSIRLTAVMFSVKHALGKDLTSQISRVQKCLLLSCIQYWIAPTEMTNMEQQDGGQFQLHKGL